MGDIRGWQSWLSAIWAGLLLTIGALAAPVLFQMLERQQAGQVAGQLFWYEARISLLLSVVMIVLEIARLRREQQMSLPKECTSWRYICLLVLLWVLALTVIGHFVLHPMIQSVKAGQTTVLSFGTLHGLSTGIFVIKGLMVLAMSWRWSVLGRW